jgi:NDP-sugar pyrophosphorylase family protein
MKAMILAAGLGTRLRPLTDTRPKALVELEGRPLLDWVIAWLVRHGVREIVINAHYLADQVVAFVERYPLTRRHAGVKLAVSREETLLDTGGGVQRAAWFFDDGQPFLVYNADVLTDLDLSRLMAAHRASAGLATLAVQQRQTTRYLLFDEQNRLCGWQSFQTGETRMGRPAGGPMHPLAFTGIQVMSPAIFDRWTLSPPFSLIDAYLALAAAGEQIAAFHADDARWIGVGRPADLDRAAALFGPAYFDALRGE